MPSAAALFFLGLGIGLSFHFAHGFGKAQLPAFERFIITVLFGCGRQYLRILKIGIGGFGTAGNFRIFNLNRQRRIS